MLGAFRTNATPNLNEGSLFIGNASNQTETLSIGPVDTVLTSTGTTIEWGNPYTASSGILLTGTNFTNTDKGSSQNIFKNIVVSNGQGIAATNNNDTLTIDGEGGIVTERAGQTVIVKATEFGGQTPADYAVATTSDPVSADVQYFYIFTCHGDFTLNTMHWFQTSSAGQTVEWGIYKGDLSSATLVGQGAVANVSVGINSVTLIAEENQSLSLRKGFTYIIAHEQHSGNGSVACIEGLSNSSLAVTTSPAERGLPPFFPDPTETYSTTIYRPCVSLVP